jgi:hypothetical protein
LKEPIKPCWFMRVLDLLDRTAIFRPDWTKSDCL